MKYAYRFSLAVFFLTAVLSLGKIPGTNSFFMDTATVAGNEISAGYWIPELEMSYSPSSPDGDNNFYKTAPCVTLKAKLGGLPASLSEVDIFYEFSNDGDPADGGMLYDGTCVEVPDGNPTHFQAIAVNKANSDWKSNIVSGQFKVDTQCPFVKITNPDGGDILSGAVEIRGTVTDANPHHYWLVIENSSGTKIAGPGTVNYSNSFTDKKFFDWDTTAVADGNYKIKLEARDAAGNKCPDLAPVPSDPNNPDDSMDWISVTVNNTSVKAGDVVINEVMWMGSKDKTKDQWIELKNVSGHDLHLNDWYLTYKSDAENENELYEIKDNRIIKSGEYVLISYYSKSKSAINVNPDYNIDKIFDYNKFQIKLYTDSTRSFLVDVAGSGNTEPTKGDKSNFYSMERNDTPGDGKNYDNWHTCLDATSTDLYWDSGRTERGTPGYDNLSENDPTADDYKKEKDNNNDEEKPAGLDLKEEPLEMAVQGPTEGGILPEDETGNEGDEKKEIKDSEDNPAEELKKDETVLMADEKDPKEEIKEEPKEEDEEKSDGKDDKKEEVKDEEKEKENSAPDDEKDEVLKKDDKNAVLKENDEVKNDEEDDKKDEKDDDREKKEKEKSEADNSESKIK